MKKIITLLALCIGVSSFSQTEEAIINFNDGTQVSGLAKIKKGAFGSLSNVSIKYRKEKNAKKQTFNHTTVKSIIFTNEWAGGEYHYKIINENKSPKLLEMIIKGKATLYILENQTYSSPIVGSNGTMVGGGTHSSTSYYVSKGDDDIAHHIGTVGGMGKSFKKLANEYFKDCPELIEKINKKELKKYDIEKAVLFYNKNCSNTQSQ